MPIGSPADHGPIFLFFRDFSFLLENFKNSKFHHQDLWDRFHATFSDLPNFRSQEKGVLAKGVLQRPVSRLRKQKIPKGIGPSNSFGTQSTAAKRGVHFCKTPF